ncbi:MAG: DUF1553 domain-containing protein, partial [Gemmataceae bacterium]|nr:DUF1553 domain-containing protein [Gemmataceae bacterium]
RTPDSVVIVDYQTVKPAEWLPDGVGIVSVRPGDWLPGAPIATAHAAAADPAWFDHSVHKESQVEPGDLGKVTRAGRSIRTPSVMLTGKRIYFRARGKGFAYAAVQSYAMFEGPLHRQLTLKFDAGPDFRWLALDTARFVDHRAHVEFSALAPDFAVSQVVIADRMPPEPETVTVDAVAQRKIVAKWAAGEVVDTIEAGVIDALMRRPGADTDSIIKPAMDCERRLASPRESHLAGAMWEGTGFTGRVAIRGNPKSPGDIAVRRLPEALAGTAEVSGPGGGRLVIARQLTDPANPLVARVIVNRVWHHLMGRGIVASVDNFGVLGEAPTHPELLDHLADRFVREGWSIKKLIRAIVLTETFAQSSAPRPDALKTDPENKLLHRAHLRRLEGEAVRDALLQLSGRLDAKMFGPPVPTHLSPFMEGRGRPGSSGPADGAGRRSIYLEVRRNFLSPFFLAFDAPTPFSTVGRRTVSNVPAQALILLNDPFVREQSKLWAARTPDVDRMYREAFGRLPDDAERAACRAFAEKHGPAELAHALVNAKEFVYVH